MQAVLILAGGQSSRMGMAKAQLLLPNGQTLLDFHIDNATYLDLPILIADNGKGFEITNQDRICLIDDYLPSDPSGKGQGALSAIVAGLQCLDNDGFLLVVSCDNLLKINEIAKILTHTTTQVGYLKNGKDYPLLGIYHTSILPALTQFLENGNRSVMQFLTLTTCQTFELDSKLQALANFNTMTEFYQALEIFND